MVCQNQKFEHAPVFDEDSLQVAMVPSTVSPSRYTILGRSLKWFLISFWAKPEDVSLKWPYGQVMCEGLHLNRKWCREGRTSRGGLWFSGSRATWIEGFIPSNGSRHIRGDGVFLRMDIEDDITWNVVNDGDRVSLELKEKKVKLSAQKLKALSF